MCKVIEMSVCMYGSLFAITVGQMLMISDQNTQAHPLGMTMCVVQMPLSEKADAWC